MSGSTICHKWESEVKEDVGGAGVAAAEEAVDVDGTLEASLRAIVRRTYIIEE